VVDDDVSVSKGLCRLLRAGGYEPEAFNSAAEFIKKYQGATTGCLVLDISMPGITGLELQKLLSQLNSPLPVIFLTGQADIATTVRAMKGGAIDFLTKPVVESVLFAAIDEALRRGAEINASEAIRNSILERLATLTPREREVFDHVVRGQLNKQVAADLGTVEKTIKVHRARVMEKMGVGSLAELARLAERIGVSPIPPAAPAQGHRASS